MSPAPAGRARRATTRLVALLAAAGLVGACGDLRLETPPPPTPSPDAVEQVRDATARDAVALAEAAADAAEREPVEVAGVLVQVAEASQAHAAALGGVYEPFPGATAQPRDGGHDAGTGGGADDGSAAPTEAPTATPTVTPTVTPGATPAPHADAAHVLALLEAAVARAAADADTVVDGDLARLLGSVAVSRRLLADALALASGGGEATTPPTAAPLTGPAAVPDELPAGLAADDVVALVLSEDAAGMVWEVVAARSGDQARAAAAARARVHRERAEAWATTAGFAGTADDPRRSAYDLPAELTAAGATQEAVAAVAESLEAELAVAHATLVARTAPGGRTALLGAVAEQVRRGLGAGAPAPAFPGLPERA